GNAIMRRFERQCDAEALARTKDPAAYRSAFVKLGEMNLADPDPARWIEIMFHDHPALSKRIAMADAAFAGGAGEAAGNPPVG
ncbi:MAG: M48 family peptidase, partial [Phycisphaerae bacterium]